MVKNLERVEGFKRWLKDSGKSQHTIDAYSRDVIRFLKYIGKPIPEITPLDISAWYVHLRKTRKYSERSLCRCGWSLKRFFLLCGRYQFSMLVPTPSYEVKEAKWLEKNIVFKIIENASWREKPSISIAYDLALRIGEVLLLRREELRKNVIVVHSLKHRKSPKLYNMEISPWCMDILKPHLERVKGRKLFPCSKSLITYYWRKATKRVRVNSSTYTFHSLRHSRITHYTIDLIKTERIADPLRIAKFARHVNTANTMLYIHLASKYLRIGEEFGK